jgi:hypothetical protein
VKRLLEFYDTIGLFPEDVMESIHAIVNALARRYAALDAERMVIQSTRSFEGRKRSAIATQMQKVDESKPPTKRRRRQGAGKGGSESTIEIVDDKKYDAAVASAVSFLEHIESADAEHAFLGPDTKLIRCEKCRSAGTDTLVPEDLLPLHDLIVHSDKGAEIPV